MTKFINVIRFTQRPSTGSPEDLQIGAFLTAWILYINATSRDPRTSEFHAPVVLPPPDKRAGKLYHYWLKLGLLSHISGFDFANHYIKLPVAWLQETFQTLTKEAFTDEEGIYHESEQIIVTNAVHYKQKLRANNTHCLVWINDSRYEHLKPLITYNNNMPSNIIAEDKFFSVIALNGEFYVEPEIK